MNNQIKYIHLLYVPTMACNMGCKYCYLEDNTKEKKEEQKKSEQKYYNCSAVGSDEVGTGDYFGPIVVTATYVDKSNIDFLLELGVKDSKKMSDEQILSIVPKILKNFTCSSKSSFSVPKKVFSITS